MELLAAGRGRTAPLLIVCGETLDAKTRGLLVARLRREVPAVRAVLVERLCRDGIGLEPPSSVAAVGTVVAACSTARALAIVGQLVELGADTARCAGVALTVGAERPDLLLTVCTAAARRAEALAREAPAGRERLQLRGAFGRRALLTAWRPVPRRVARVEVPRCLGVSGCGFCLAACPEGALRVREGSLVVDPLRCTRCGACAFVCPSGALSLPGAALGPLAAQLECLVAGGVSEVDLVCERAAEMSGDELVGRAAGGPRSTAVEVGVPCPAAVAPGLLLQLAARGCRARLECCVECSRRGRAEETERFVAEVLEAVGVVDVGNRLKSGSSRERAGGGGPLELKEPAATSAALRELLEDRDGRKGDRTPTSRAVVMSEVAPTGVITIDAACTRCGACTLVCPAGALRSREAGDALSLDPTCCVACGRCVAVCPEGAVRVERGLDLGALAGTSRAPCDEGAPSGGGSGSGPDPIAAAVARRLAAQGASEALLKAIRTRDGDLSERYA